MRVHHLNCGCMCPLGGRLFDGFSKGLTAQLVCHCLAIETDSGIVLVDTGFGTRDVEQPTERLSAFFRVFNNIQRREDHTARAQLLKRGLSPSDVRHIILTHLDFDHAGGLDDFPNATVHLLQAEMDAASRRNGFIGTRRYRPGQWNSVGNWQFYAAGGEPWFGFKAVRALTGLPPEILLVPLIGHTLGHSGIAIDTGDGWLLHAGDAYFYRDEIGQSQRHCTPGLRVYQTMMEAHRGARLHNQERLRDLSLSHADMVQIFCSHDAVELHRMQAKSTTTVAGPPARAVA